ncbi:MAG: hypothetical protein ACI85O_001873 [Saprospiraceae bacterium]|jgi:hypothetical protein
MNRQEIEDRLHFLFLQLRVITIDRKSFIENEGESGTQARIDAILDEVHSLRQKLDNLNDK